MIQTDMPSVMLLSHSDEERSPLRGLFADAGWTVYEGEYLADLVDQVYRGWKGVVISDFALPDASWRKILSSMRSGCELIVTSHLADDRMWSELLDAGAFDLFAYPLDTVEMLRVAGAAWRQAISSVSLGSPAGRSQALRFRSRHERESQPTESRTQEGSNNHVTQKMHAQQDARTRHAQST